MDDEYKRFISEDWVSEKELLQAMWESNGSRSHLKGTAVEQSFRKLVRSQGWESEKIPDSDKKRRYDFLVSTPWKQLRFEVKNLLPKNILPVGFRDYRYIDLPSGVELKTKVRTIQDEFDILAICLANYTTIKDFVFIRFCDIPHYQSPKRPRTWLEEAVERELKRLKSDSIDRLQEDERWKTENLLVSSLHVSLPVESPPYYNDISEVIESPISPKTVP